MAERGPPQSNSSPELDVFNSMYSSLRTAIANNIGSVAAKAVSAFLITTEQLAECTNRHLPSQYDQADRFLQIIKGQLESSAKPNEVMKRFIGVLRQELTLEEKAKELEETLDLMRRREQLRHHDDDDDERRGSEGSPQPPPPPAAVSNMVDTGTSVDKSGDGTADVPDSTDEQQQTPDNPASGSNNDQSDQRADNRWWPMCVCL